MLHPGTPSASRRDFLTSLAGSLAAPLIVPASVLGRGSTPPSDRVTIGIIGSGNRGVFEAKHFVPMPDCEIVALCDVQETRRVGAKATFEKLYAERKPDRNSPGIRLYPDFRELLQQKDIDAVYIATPDHWHVPILISALQAGKSCHCEKPLGVSIEQDLAALAAVHKYKQPFFYGPERRSTPDARHGIELVLNGRIGKVEKIYVVSPPSKSGGSATPVLPVPEGFNFDMWLGPAPEAPFCADRVGEGMFYIYDYCLGFIANWGAHPMDQVQWWADNAKLTIPVTYEGGGKLAQGGLYNTAIEWDVRCTYDNGLVMNYMDSESYSRKTGVPRPIPKVHNGAIFVGTEGTVTVAYDKVFSDPPSLIASEIGPNEIHLQQSPLHPERATGKGIWDYPPSAHQLAWIESLRAQKPGVHSIESAVSSDLICQLSDICVRTGGPVRWDPKKQTISGNEDARKMMSRQMRTPWRILS